MNDQVLVAGLVEETFEYQCILSRQCTERGVRGSQVFHHLHGSLTDDTAFAHQPFNRRVLSIGR